MRIRYGNANKSGRIAQVSAAAIVNVAPIRRSRDVIMTTAANRGLDCGFGWDPHGLPVRSIHSLSPGHTGLVHGRYMDAPQVPGNIAKLGSASDSQRFMKDRQNRAKAQS